MLRFFTSKWFLALIAVFVLIIGMGLGRMILQNRALANEIATLEDASRRMQDKNKEFLALTKRFETDAFLEREARLKLNLQKPGERVFIVHETGASASSTPSRGIGLVSDDNLVRWWRYFFPSTQHAPSL